MVGGWANYCKNESIIPSAIEYLLVSIWLLVDGLLVVDIAHNLMIGMVGMVSMIDMEGSWERP